MGPEKFYRYFLFDKILPNFAKFCQSLQNLTKSRQTVLWAPWTDFDNFCSVEKLCFWIFERFFLRVNADVDFPSKTRCIVVSLVGWRSRSLINLWDSGLQLKVLDQGIHHTKCECGMRMWNSWDLRKEKRSVSKFVTYLRSLWSGSCQSEGRA